MADLETIRINLRNIDVFLSEAAKIGGLACPKAIKRAEKNRAALLAKLQAAS